MNDLEMRHLRLLFEIRLWAQQHAVDDAARLEDYVLELRDSGCSVSRIAEALEVGISTVQGWTKNARQRRNQDG